MQQSVRPVVSAAPSPYDSGVEEDDTREDDDSDYHGDYRQVLGLSGSLVGDVPVS